MNPSQSQLPAEAQPVPLSPRIEAAAFFRAWLRGPLRIASLTPSSNAMGRAFAEAIDLDREGDVLELGSGTGAISRALLDAGVPATRLIMIEREPDLAAHARRRFPAARIVTADATDIAPVLERLEVHRISVVVSTLPIVWFPLEAQAAVLNPCLDRLGEGGCILQMTNLPRSPLPMKKLGLAGDRAAHVWRNLPPSFIWRYWRP